MCRPRSSSSGHSSMCSAWSEREVVGRHSRLHGDRTTAYTCLHCDVAAQHCWGRRQHLAARRHHCTAGRGGWASVLSSTMVGPQTTRSTGQASWRNGPRGALPRHRAVRSAPDAYTVAINLVPRSQHIDSPVACHCAPTLLRVAVVRRVPRVRLTAWMSRACV